MKTIPLTLVIASILMIGCNKDDMNKMVADAKESAGELKSSASEAIDKARTTANESMTTATASAKDAMTKARSSVEEAMTKAEQVTKKAAELSPLIHESGNATMNLDRPVNFVSSYIRIVPLDSDNSVLQITSTLNGEPKTFPAFMIQGDVNAKSLQELMGKSVACRVFAQAQPESAIWSNVESAPIMVKVQHVDGKFTASFDQGKLINSATQATTMASGKFDCAKF